MESPSERLETDNDASNTVENNESLETRVSFHLLMLVDKYSVINYSSKKTSLNRKKIHYFQFVISNELKILLYLSKMTEKCEQSSRFKIWLIINKYQ